MCVIGIVDSSADERNPTSREIIMKRVEGYMTRAEQLRELIETKAKPKPVSAGGTYAYPTRSHAFSDTDDESGDPEKTKMRGALSGMPDKCSIHMQRRL